MGDFFVHESSCVDDDVIIGEGTKIWHFCHIQKGARIGAGCTIGQNVYVDSDVVIGDHVKLQNNVSVYHGVEIEDDVFVGPSAVFTNDLFPRAVSDEWEVSPTLIKKGASIGANATIICGTTIAEYATIGSGSVVTKDVKAHALMTGNPAKQAGWVCECGYKLTEDMKCPHCGKAYSIVEGVLKRD